MTQPNSNTGRNVPTRPEKANPEPVTVGELDGSAPVIPEQLEIDLDAVEGGS